MAFTWQHDWRASTPRMAVVVGYKLRRWVRDNLPPECTAGECTVAVEIADNANDDTRLALAVKVEELAYWARFKSVKSVGQALKGLADKGWELRVEVCKDKKGRPVYAYEGRKTIYRIPTAGEVGLEPEVRLGTDLSPSDAPRGPSVDDRGPLQNGPLGPEVRSQTDPSPHCSFPQEDLISLPTESRALATIGVDPGEREIMIREIPKLPGLNIKGPGWWITASKNGTLAAHVATVRAKRSARSAKPAAPAPEPDPELCGHGTSLGVNCAGCTQDAAAKIYADVSDLYHLHEGRKPKLVPPWRKPWDQIDEEHRQGLCARCAAQPEGI